MFDLRLAIRSPVRRPNHIFRSPTRNTGSSFPDPAVRSVADSTHSIHVANSMRAPLRRQDPYKLLLVVSEHEEGAHSVPHKRYVPNRLHLYSRTP